MQSIPRLSLPPALLAFFAVFSAGTAEAQTVQPLVTIGDDIFGVGKVTDIITFSMSDGGDWLVLIEARVGSSFDEVLLRNGIPTVQQRDQLVSPTGASVLAMDLPSFNAGYDIAWILDFYGYPTSENTGCFIDTKILLQESKLSIAPEFSAGTTWLSFAKVRINNNRQIICQGAVEDSAISGSGDVVLVLLTVDEDGNLVSEQAVLKEGTSYGGRPAMSALGPKTHTLAFNNNGDYLTFLDTTGAAADDGNIFLNHVSVAQENRDSPVPGRQWSNLGSPRLDLNDYGEYVHNGTLEGDGTTNLLISKSGQKFMQEGDVIPGVAPFAVFSLHTAPIFITNASRVIWFTQFTAPDSSRNKGIFLDDQLLVRIGVTPVGRQYVRTLRTYTEAFFVPPDGRSLMFWAILDNMTKGVFLMDLGTVVPVPGCYGNTATLKYTDGLPLLGNRLAFQMDNAQGIGVTPVFLVSTLPVTGWPPCGIDTGIAGELLIDISAQRGNPALFELGPPWAGVPVELSLDIPDDTALAGLEFYVQGIFWDIGNVIPEQNLLLTNGIRVVIATP